MPDLQSELSKIASAWDTHEQTIRNPQTQTQTTQEKAMELQPTTNETITVSTYTPTPSTNETFTKSGVCSRDTFDLIRLNPHKFTTVSAANKLVNLNYRKTSIFSLFTQMKRNGMLKEDENGRLFTTANAYTPFANPYKTNPVNKPNSLLGRTPRTTTKKRKTQVKAQAPAGLAALPVLKDEVTGVTQTLTATPNPARLVRMQTADEVLANMSVAEAHKLYLELAKIFGGK
jgi:hypothetical protein